MVTRQPLPNAASLKINAPELGCIDVQPTLVKASEQRLRVVALIVLFTSARGSLAILK